MALSYVSVTPSIITTLHLKLKYINSEDSSEVIKEIDLVSGGTDPFTVEYLDGESIITIIGRVKDIITYTDAKPEQVEKAGLTTLAYSNYTGYKILFDYSKQYESSQVLVDVADIRTITKVDTTTTGSETTSSGTTTETPSTTNG